MRFWCLTLPVLAALSAACDSESTSSDGDDYTLSGLWNFFWQTDGKDDPDILTVRLEQKGTSISGRGCSVDYEERAGVLYVGATTCDKEFYEGKLRDSILTMTVFNEEQRLSLKLTVSADGTMLQGTGAGERCDGCAVSATPIDEGDPVE